MKKIIVLHLRGFVSLLRTKQWVKNGFVLGPLLFSGGFLNQNSIYDAFGAAILFCIASSATYILNDIRDVNHDRSHPKKSLTRPLAVGVISVNFAYGVLVSLYLILAYAWLLAPKVMLVIYAYLLLNITYSFFLKGQPVLDIFTIAIGFVLRVISGSIAISQPISNWMCITTLCLALYLGAIKRRQELIHVGEGSRFVLGRYSVSLIDRYAEMSATCALVFYSLFVMTENQAMILTIPVVLFGLFRYWYVVESLDGGESPTDALLGDWPLLITVIFWILLSFWAVI